MSSRRFQLGFFGFVQAALLAPLVWLGLLDLTGPPDSAVIAIGLLIVVVIGMGAIAAFGGAALGAQLDRRMEGRRQETPKHGNRNVVFFILGFLAALVAGLVVACWK
jgi:hypothetical protein